MSTLATGIDPSPLSRVMVTRNILWNLLGQVVPLAAGLLFIPALIDALGTDRFGLLNLVWLFVGYFSLFDLGLGRAITIAVAGRIGSDNLHGLPSLIWTGWIFMSVLGVLGLLVVWLLAPWLVNDVLNVPYDLRSNTIVAFSILALGLPIVITNAGLRGVLEAHQRFGIVNAVRIPLGIATFAAPLAVTFVSTDLSHVVAALVLVRLLGWTMMFVACLKVIPGLHHAFTFDPSVLTPLLRIGGWITISNVVGPVLLYVDRFVIGALATMAAVAYYATPYEVVTKLGVIPGAVVGVLLPSIAMSAARDAGFATSVFLRAANGVMLVMTPIVLCVIVLAHDALSFWLGSEWADEGYRVLQVLAVGVFLNAVAQPVVVFLQGHGRPDLIAKLHVLELPPYILLLVVLFNTFGLEGVALAWAVRMGIDLAANIVVARFMFPHIAPSVHRVLIGAVVCSAIMGVAMTATHLADKGWLLCFLIIAFLLIGWRTMLDPEDRTSLARMLLGTFVRGRSLK